MPLLTAILPFLGSLFGISSGDSVVNKVSGVVNHATMLALGGWLLAHKDETINFSTTYAFLALVVVVGWLVMEIARRSKT